MKNIKFTFNAGLPDNYGRFLFLTIYGFVTSGFYNHETGKRHPTIKYIDSNGLVNHFKESEILGFLTRET